MQLDLVAPRPAGGGHRDRMRGLSPALLTRRLAGRRAFAKRAVKERLETLAGVALNRARIARRRLAREPGVAGHKIDRAVVEDAAEVDSLSARRGFELTQLTVDRIDGCNTSSEEFGPNNQYDQRRAHAVS